MSLLMNKKDFRKLKEIKSKMSLSDRYAYAQLRYGYPILNILLMPFYAAFYLGVFTIIMSWAYGIDLFDPAKKLIAYLFSIYIVFPIAIVVLLIVGGVHNYRLDRDLINSYKDKKWKEKTIKKAKRLKKR